MVRRATKIERGEDEAHLERWAREGRVREQQYSLSAAELRDPDQAYQSRVGLDIEHVHDLAAALARDGSLKRVVLFEFPDGRVVPAAGFHRIAAYMAVAKGLPDLKTIPAYVVLGSAEEAIQFSVLSNKRLVKKPTAADKRKAASMYFDNETLRTLPFAQIAREVGTNTATVEMCWQSWCQTRGVATDRDRTEPSPAPAPSASPAPEPVARYERRVDKDTGRVDAFMVVEGRETPLGPHSRKTVEKFEREKSLAILERAARDGLGPADPARVSAAATLRSAGVEAEILGVSDLPAPFPRGVTEILIAGGRAVVVVEAVTERGLYGLIGLVSALRALRPGRLPAIILERHADDSGKKFPILGRLDIRRSPFRDAVDAIRGGDDDAASPARATLVD